MAYIYSEHRHFTLTEEGQAAVCAVLLAAYDAARESGIVTHHQLDRAVFISDSWNKLALIDRIVELGYLRPVSTSDPRQDYVYRWSRRS